MRMTNQRYEEIKRTIGDFLDDYGVSTLPVDVFDLVEKMKIKVVLASKLLRKYPKKIDECILFKYPNSFLYYDPDNQRFVIYIDDVGCRKKRQRFSLAHELMHIILGHTEQNEKNETEANFGATYLLMPTSLVLIAPKECVLLLPEVVSEIFDVSLPAAMVAVRYNSNRLSLLDLDEREYEKTINNLLGESLMSQVRRYHQ